MAIHILSKSSYMQGHQCPKRLYLSKFRRDLLPPVDEQRQAIFDTGTRVGELAQQLFPEGVDVRPGTPFDFAPSIEATRSAIASGVQVIYEAAFMHDDVLAALDILVRNGDGWKAYEVKSSSAVRDYHIQDVALQAHVIEGSGLQLNDVSIIHINTAYVRQGAIDIRQLFGISSVKSEVDVERKSVPGRIAELKAMLAKHEEPAVPIGPHCGHPFACDFIYHCWKHVPQDSVFDLKRGGARAWEFLDKGILRMADIPEEEPLTTSQQMQVQGVKHGTVHIDHARIASFVNDLRYPLYHFDFETFMTAVPLYDASRPYQQIPFQYSIHVQAREGATPMAFAFLGDGTRDPREALTRQLLRDLGTEGDVLVYNSSFERGKLRELARDLPQYAAELACIIERLKDLMTPFQQAWYYTPAMHGSYSIKKVLPALVPDLSYADLNVQEGGMASLLYSQLAQGQYTGDKQQLRTDLLAYCGLDTLAMVRILEVLCAVG